MRNLRLDNVTIILIGACCITTAIVLLSGFPVSSLEEDLEENGTTRNEHKHKNIGVLKSNGSVNTPIDGYSEILKRPLFSSSRRPREELSDNALERAYESPVARMAGRDLLLIGIIIIGGDQIALLQIKGSQTIEKVQVGDLIEGWLITSLSKSAATMKRGEETRTLEMARNSDPRLTPRTRQTRWR